jgi:hypothetical protein
MSEGSSSDAEMPNASHDVVDLAQEDSAGGEAFGLSTDQMAAFVVVFDKVQDILQDFDEALPMLDEQLTPWMMCEVVCAAAIARRAGLPLDRVDGRRWRDGPATRFGQRLGLAGSSKRGRSHRRG